MKLQTALATALLALCALLAWAGTAAAAPAKVPPGNSGAAQYTETLPGVGGDQTASGVREGQSSGKSGGAGSSLGAGKAARLKKLGKEGADAARLAAGGAAAGQGGKGGGGEGSAASGDASGAGQVVGAATGSSDSGGMGLLLPLLIAVGVLAAIGYVVYRRRYAPLPPEGD